jgi:hypothetical protein
VLEFRPLQRRGEACYTSGVDTTTLLLRLRDPSPDGPLDRLAALALEALLDQPLQALLPAGSLESSLRRGLAGWLSEPTALAWLSRGVDACVNGLRADRRALEEVTPREVRESLRALVARPLSPDRRVVLALIDREPMRALVREILLDAVLQFARKASAPVAGVAKGLGSLARFASDQVRARSGGLGSLVGAVSDEVERQLERRATEFVDLSLSSVFGHLADVLSDPRRADEAAALRLEVLSGVMELTLAQLARELANADAVGGAEVLRDGLRRWLAAPESERGLARGCQLLVDAAGPGALRQILAEAGLLPAATSLAREHLRAALKLVAETPAFGEWLDSVQGA